MHDEHANLNNPFVKQASKDDAIFVIFKDRKFETQRKISKRFSEWKWSEVMNLDDSDNNDKEEELENTVDSSTNQKTKLKIPRVSIQKRNRFHAV
ncbi:hypothetical protein HanXRQr2_Chr15g0687441 [Helianthus annuus]|uniref:Uncharacterized protein n=1 Tax=Helianthus annuus TaxID=4232 RepID=A0A9K3E0L1_HELAN|nr:hypothetical protein HanXRQr2_Chr15g0687441 [Helianthus annuus]